MTRISGAIPSYHRVRWLAWLWLFGLVLSSFGQVTYERIRSFGFIPQLGTSPISGVIEGSDGWLYGTTLADGIAGVGVVFRMAKDGSGYTTLHQFTGVDGDGARPLGGLLEGSDGALYGTTRDAGTNDNGTIFKINKDGTGYAVLLRFDGGDQGSSPHARLIEGGDAKLYGVAAFAGTAGNGTIFRLNKNGTGFEVLHHFTGGLTDGSEPRGRVFEADNGVLYGTTYGGGSAGAGILFKINRDGTGYGVLRHLSAATDGRRCTAGLLQATNNLLFGVASVGGTFNRGTVFRVDTNGAGFTVLHHFPTGGGENPFSELAEGPGGVLYGSTHSGGNAINGTLFKIAPDGTGYAIIHHFEYFTTAARPQGVLWFSSDGFFYGTTIQGGLVGSGTAYKIKPDGSEYTQLRSFTFSGGDAYSSKAPVLEASDGKLYGVAHDGGIYDGGVVFRMNRDGSAYSILHHFTWLNDGGSNPYAGLTEASNGVLYGTTEFGGISNKGTIFRINKDGSGFTTLRVFTGVIGTGAHPSATLLEASDGKLYGRLSQGGVSNATAIFRLNQDGSDFSIIKSFNNPGFTSSPDADLIEGQDGALYGTSMEEGPTEDGTIWKMNKDGTGFTLLHTFGAVGDGDSPDGPLLQRADGTLLGTASFGGLFDNGTLYRLNPDGTGYTNLHHFNYSVNSSEGEWPRGRLIEVSNGVLLGSTYLGGTNYYGTIYLFGLEGNRYSMLHQLSQPSGGLPIGGFTRGRDGTLYGTTEFGGDLDLGVVFRMAPFKLHGYVAPPNFRLAITGSTGQIYAIDASAVLPPVWTQIGRLTNLTGQVELPDALAGHTNRFYRARWLLP